MNRPDFIEAIKQEQARLTKELVALNALSELYGMTKVGIVNSKSPKGLPGKRKVRTCGACGKSGHDVRQCPKTTPDKPKGKGFGIGSQARHCKNCGKTGHRRDTCPDGERKAPQQREYEEGIDRDTIDEIQRLKAEDYTSKEAAAELGISIATVNQYWSKKEVL